MAEDSSRRALIDGTRRTTRRGGLGPAIIVAVGLAGLASRYLDLASWNSVLLPALGLAFLLAAVFAKRFGLLVPGGVLLGLGIGLYFQNGPLIDADRDLRVGVMLLCFGAGWALITALSPLMLTRTAIWPLIPGAALGTAGVVLVFGLPYEDLWRFVDWIWPFALILIGILLLLRRRR